MILSSFKVVLFLGLICCAVAACLAKKVLTTVAVFMSYSVIMSILWIVLESPDLAITEAAVGAGITSVLFFVTLREIHEIGGEGDVDE